MFRSNSFKERKKMNGQDKLWNSVAPTQAGTFRLHDTHPILQKYVSDLQNLQIKKKISIAIADPGCLSPDPNFFCSGSRYRVKIFRIPDLDPQQRIFNPKNGCSRKYDPGCSSRTGSRIRISFFYQSRILDTGFIKAPDPGFVALKKSLI